MIRKLGIVFFSLCLGAAFVFNVSTLQGATPAKGKPPMNPQVQQLQQEIQMLKQQAEPLRAKMKELKAQIDSTKAQLAPIQAKLKADHEKMQSLVQKK